MTPEEFSLPLRVYIEDTDAGGIVYYVNYLKFLERARTEYMRSLGFGKDYIFNHDLMFVVRDVAVNYLKPAQLDDEILATAQITELRRASMSLLQRVLRGGETLAEGAVTIACVDRTGVRPRRLPADMAARLARISSGRAASGRAASGRAASGGAASGRSAPGRAKVQ